MSRVIVIPPSVPLVQEVLSHLVSADADYSGNVVIFPGKRPAHFLRKAIGERLHKSFVPPRIFSIELFVDYLYERHCGHPIRDLAPSEAALILHQLHTTAEERIGGTRFEAFEDFLPLGLRIFAELEELVMTGQPVEKVLGEFSRIEFRGLHTIGSLYERFYANVAGRSYSTRALRYVKVSEQFSLELLDIPARIIVAGFFALTPVENALLHRLMALDQTVVIFQQGKGLEQRLRDLHITVDVSPGEYPEPIVSLYSASGAHGEVFGLTAKLKECIDSGATLDEHTVIVVPSAETLPAVLHQSLALLSGGQYNISLGYPHIRTPVFGFLTALMEVITSMYEGKIHASKYLTFLLHPYTKSLLFQGRADITRVLVHTVEDAFLRKDLPTFFLLEELENHPGLFERAAARTGERGVTSEKLRRHLQSIHGNTIAALLDARTLGDLATRSIDVLGYVAAHSTARLHPLFRPYVQSLADSLARISGSLLAEQSFDRRDALFQVLRGCVAQGEVPFPGTPLQGVQVLGFLETRNLRFHRIFFLNVNEDVIPGTGKGHTLIPQTVRRALGLSTREHDDAIAAYYFDLLLQGAREVHLFFTENDEKAASRFVEQLLWQEQQRAGEMQRDRIVSTVRYRANLVHSTPAPIRKTPEIVNLLRGMEFDATGLEMYLRCGLRFYYHHMLRLREREEVDEDVDRLGLGNIVHKILQEFFAPFVGKELQVTEFEVARLDKIIERRFVEDFGNEEVGNRYLLKLQVREQLQAYLERFEAPRLRNTSVTLLGLEQPYHVKKNGYMFKGRIDRIEQHPDHLEIHDYKTGGDGNKLKVRFQKLDVTRRETWDKAIGSLQLPMYTLLYAGATGEPIEKITPSFILLGKARLDLNSTLSLYGKEDDPQTRFAILEKIIFSLVDELTNPEKMFEPTTDFQENCPTCPFTTLCGTAWVKGRGYG